MPYPYQVPPMVDLMVGIESCPKILAIALSQLKRHTASCLNLAEHKALRTVTCYDPLKNIWGTSLN